MKQSKSRWKDPQVKIALILSGKVGISGTLDQSLPSIGDDCRNIYRKDRKDRNN